MARSPDTLGPLTRPTRHASRRKARALERSLRIAGWAAHAWVSWRWLDARLFQAQQDRLFAETIGAARLQQLAVEGRDPIDPGSPAQGLRLAPSRGGAGQPGQPGRAIAGPRAGTLVEIDGAGPARITEPVAEPTAAPAVARAAAAAAPSSADSPQRRADSTPASLSDDGAWGGASAGAEALGRLSVARLGMRVMVAPGVDARSLRRAAGHIPGTSRPGTGGNVGIAGHRDTFFRPLRRIEPGDEIELTTPEGVARYAVEWTRVVAPDAVDVLAPTPYAALTLVTCYPFYYVGHAPDRFIVRARRVDDREPVAAEIEGR